MYLSPPHLQAKKLPQLFKAYHLLLRQIRLLGPLLQVHSQSQKSMIVHHAKMSLSSLLNHLLGKSAIALAAANEAKIMEIRPHGHGDFRLANMDQTVQ